MDCENQSSACPSVGDLPSSFGRAGKRMRLELHSRWQELQAAWHCSCVH